MNRQQIELLRQQPELRDAEVVETHISWLLLTPDKVYKMKKAVRFSFLDFSTLSRRKFYCEHELKLNQRLAPDLYEDVVAVNTMDGGLAFGHYQFDSVDYAIRMRRVAHKWEMPRMLEEDRVLPEDMDRLAEKLAAFHQDVPPDQSLFNPIQALDEFSDIANYTEELTPLIGKNGMEEILDSIKAARSFLRKHHQRFHYRRMLGFTVEGHGDLHVSNIFLEEGKPLIFDCIEFNDAFRRVDVLDEIAFLCIDLEAYRRDDLAERFAASYQAGNRTIITEDDARLFDYYKCYRANVRLKVTAIKLSHLSPEARPAQQLARLHRYYEIFQKYADKLSAYDVAASEIPGLTEALLPDSTPTGYP